MSILSGMSEDVNRIRRELEDLPQDQRVVEIGVSLLALLININRRLRVLDERLERMERFLKG